MSYDSGGDTTLTISATALSSEPTCLQALPAAVVTPAPNDSDTLLIDTRVLKNNFTSFMNLYTECPRAAGFRTATEAAAYATSPPSVALRPRSTGFFWTNQYTISSLTTGSAQLRDLLSRCATAWRLPDTFPASVKGFQDMRAMDHIHMWQLFEALDDLSRWPHPHRSHLTGRIRRALAAASDDLRVLVLALLRASKRRRKALARIYKEPA